MTDRKTDYELLGSCGHNDSPHVGNDDPLLARLLTVHGDRRYESLIIKEKFKEAADK